MCDTEKIPQSIFTSISDVMVLTQLCKDLFAAIPRFMIYTLFCLRPGEIFRKSNEIPGFSSEIDPLRMYRVLKTFSCSVPRPRIS